MRAGKSDRVLRITADGIGRDGSREAVSDAASLAASAGWAVAGLRGVDHVAVLVPDIDAVLGEFGGRFGLSVASDETLGNPAVRLVHMDAGNVDLQLVEAQGPGRLAGDLAGGGAGP